MKKKDKQIFSFILLFAFIVIVLILLILIVPYKIDLQKNTTFSDNYVIRVIDGDTFVINSGQIIRLVCVDTPEKDQQGYGDAKEFLESVILNREVILNQSITDEDAYGRKLRYVYINNSCVNKMILEQKYGKLLVIPPETCEQIFD